MRCVLQLEFAKKQNGHKISADDEEEKLETQSKAKQSKKNDAKKATNNGCKNRAQDKPTPKRSGVIN